MGRTVAASTRTAGRGLARRYVTARTQWEIHRRARRARALAEAPSVHGTALTLGLPIPLIVVAFAAAALMGLLLAYALGLTTQSTGSGSSAAFDEGAEGGKNPVGPPVVTESTLGPEVQRLVDTGALQSAADFDVPECLAEQGITDKVMIMEEIEWGSGTQRAWLIVHTAQDPSDLRSSGGAVNVTVVRPTCGTHPDRPADSRLWAGSAAISGAST